MQNLIGERRVIENANEGTDSVYSFIDYSLPDHVENLILQGTARIGNGNAENNRLQGTNQDNVLNGGDGDDRLHGGGGNDTLTGGNGNDTFVFDSPLSDGIVTATAVQAV